MSDSKIKSVAAAFPYTPRTDAAAFRSSGYEGQGSSGRGDLIVYASVCRELETELYNAKQDAEDNYEQGIKYALRFMRIAIAKRQPGYIADEYVQRAKEMIEIDKRNSR